MQSLDIKTLPLFSQVTTLKAVGASDVTLIPYEWLAYGVSVGVFAILILGLIFGASTLKRSVWISQALFVATALGSLSWAFFESHAASSRAQDIFVFLLRIQLILSTITTFNLAAPTTKKQNLGSIYSAFLGSVLCASLLSFFWPLGGLLYWSELTLIAASLYLGGRFLFRQRESRFGENTLFFQLTTVLIMSGTYFLLPDLAKFEEASLFYTSVATAAMMLTTGATAYSSSKERTLSIITRLQKDLFTTERKLAKQNQVASALQIEAQTLAEQLQREYITHRHDSIRDHLRIRALEESSQDIAHGLLAHLKELHDDCSLIINETRSPKYRMSIIKAYAERSHLLSSRIQTAAGFLLASEPATANSPDSEVLINTADFLKECLYLCSHRFKKVGIEIEIQSLETDLWVKGRPALLAQGFLGLIYNALEATETADVRRVTLILRKVEDNDQPFVEFGISNSGPGIPTVIKTQAFHLKERDGLGIHSLGLSMAFGIFEHAGGSLNLDTEAVATTLLARIPLATRNEESSLRLVI
ncbi:MAG: hypothetical protein EOP10_13305 [Proteobacteria bacterium]|nr:MAG: hypothetical protein EOP10_13305 [Pseudomonadota bacterium]